MLQPFQPRQQRLLTGAGSGRSTCAHISSSSNRGEVVPPPHLDQPFADDPGWRGSVRPGQPPCLLGHAFQPVGWRVEQPALPRSGDGREDDQVAEPVEQVGGETAGGSCPPSTHPVHGAEHGRTVPAANASIISSSRLSSV